MSTSVSKAELETLKDDTLWSPLYTSSKITNSKGEQKFENMASDFHHVIRKATWYSSSLIKLNPSVDNDSVTYQVNSTFHFLCYVYRRYILPHISVKAEYRDKVMICWPHNVGVNSIKTVSFLEDDVPYHNFDATWYDINSQFYTRPGFRENYDRGVGNISFLENWSHMLPSYPINVEEPFFYSLDSSYAFPMFYKGTQARVIHAYDMRRKIVNLLRMKKQNKRGLWTYITDGKKICKYLEGISVNSVIPTPELWGRYAYVTDAELNIYKCSREAQVYYIKTVENFDALNRVTYEDKAIIGLNCKSPCLAIFWVAENQDAVAVHNFSNYTTNTDNVYEGYDPIATNDLIYETGSTAIPWKSMDSDHFNIASSRKHFPSSPCDFGYHGHSFAWDSTSVDVQIAIILAKLGAKLAVSIRDTNYFNTNKNKYITNEDHSTIDDQDLPTEYDSDGGVSGSGGSQRTKTTRISKSVKKENSDKKTPGFILRVRLLVLRKFSIIPQVGAPGTPNEKWSFKLE